MAGTCKYSDVCGRDALDGNNGLCILHSEVPEKDCDVFKKALEEHQEKHGPNFRYMVFPHTVSVLASFEKLADFRHCKFSEGAYFGDCDFLQGADFAYSTFDSVQNWHPVPGTDKVINGTLFEDVTFKQYLSFQSTRFEGSVYFDDGTNVTVPAADFSSSTFAETAYFAASFTGTAKFTEATFQKGAYFQEEALFEQGAVFQKVRTGMKDTAEVGTEFHVSSTINGDLNFSQATFYSETSFVGISPPLARFDKCNFRSDVRFVGASEEKRMFVDTVVSLKDVTVTDDATLNFRYVNLNHCHFRRTDLQEVEFTGVQWCEEVSSDGWILDEVFRRDGIYEEVEHENQKQKTDLNEKGLRKRLEPQTAPPWSEIERLYRQLKINYEDRGDFPRAGDFHMGEKIARRQNPQTHCSVWFVLTVYRALSKYGERALPAALWLLGLVILCGVAYLSMGASTSSIQLSSFFSLQDWVHAFVLSGEVSLFPVQATGFEQVGPRILNLIQRAISPILIALLALALRQRVKR